MQRHRSQSLIHIIHMIKPNQVPLTANKVYNTILVDQKLMYGPYLKR